MNKLWKILLAVAVLGTGVVLGGLLRGHSPRALVAMGREAIRSRHTVAERVRDIRAKHPELEAVAAAAGGRLTIVVFKRERRLEVRAPGWAGPRKYPMTGFSGELGPKLREGDGQIPEGVYAIEYLNPNSLFHLSLKVSYPNEFDRARAKEDGREHLGGDIMIHGGAATVGCVPIGDEAIEEVFYLVSVVGKENVRVVIAPYDPDGGEAPDVPADLPAWYPGLCAQIRAALML